MKVWDGKNYCTYKNKHGVKCEKGAYRLFKKKHLCRGHYRLATKLR